MQHIALNVLLVSWAVAADVPESDASAMLQVTEGQITKSVSKTARGDDSFLPFGNEPEKEQTEPDSTEVAMAKIASDTYSGGWRDIDTDTQHDAEWARNKERTDYYNCWWTKKMEQSTGSGILGQDKVVVFESNCYACAVAFSGDDDVGDLLKHLQVVRTVSRCGVEIHRGYYEKMQAFVQSGGFQTKIKPFLQSDRCYRVFAAGHGQGGAVASIFAGCAGKPDAPDSIKHLRVHALYTYGAPSVSRPKDKLEIGPYDHPTGQLAPDANTCFAGKRFFNVDQLDYDPVPPAATVLGFVHPQVAAVKYTDVAFRGLQKTEYKCDGDEREEPRPGLSLSVPNPLKNSAQAYVDRTEKMYPGRR